MKTMNGEKSSTRRSWLCVTPVQFFVCFLWLLLPQLEIKAAQLDFRLTVVSHRPKSFNQLVTEAYLWSVTEEAELGEFPPEFCNFFGLLPNI
jgi:hypothetical protein